MPETVSLLKTERIHLGLSRCSAVDRALSEEEVEPDFTVVFPISGVFIHHSGDRRTVATPAIALFLNRDHPHRVSHPGGGHDQSIFIVLSTDLVEPFLDVEGSVFPAPAVPTSPSTFVSVRDLARRAANGELSELDAEEFAVDTLTDLTHGKPTDNQSPRHRDLVAGAEEYLSIHFRDKTDLLTIAQQVGASPHHLSRLFRSVTGVTLSTRRTQLRLRYALAQLLDGATDISTVAVEAGFYDHSHLTNTMRTHLDTTPRQIQDRTRKPRR